MYIPSETGGQGMIAALASTPAWLMAFITQDDLPLYASIVLPIMFFVVGQGINIGLRIYLERRNK